MPTQQEVAQIFDNMANNVDPNKVEGVNATIQFDLSGDNGGQYWLKLVEGAAETGAGQIADARMTVVATADDWAAMVSGELNAMHAFMSGKIKIQGDMGLAMKLQTLIGG